MMRHLLVCVSILLCSFWTADSWAGTPAASNSKLISFIDCANNEHVVFEDANDHVHQLFDVNAWQDQDITALQNFTPAASGSHLTGFAPPPGCIGSLQPQYIFFLAANQHIIEYYYSGTQWFQYDLSALTGGALPESGGALTSYDNTTCGGGQHVAYIGANLHIYQMYYHGGSWTNQDLTAAAGGSLATAASPLASYVRGDTCGDHINFLDANSHLHNLWEYSGWTDQDLTATTRAPLVAAGSGFDSYAGGNDQEHV